MIERELPRSVWVPMLARQTITEHQTHGSCRRCRPDGCAELGWARDRIKACRVADNGGSVTETPHLHNRQAVRRHLAALFKTSGPPVRTTRRAAP
ncbi:hypothetical protein ACWD8I_20985 [Micromonospora arida]|uniref:hypothetical protein n=1 Tax=Micromonospora arida TaxID=2203715 RepID=UPI0033FC2FBE